MAQHHSSFEPMQSAKSIRPSTKPDHPYIEVSLQKTSRAFQQGTELFICNPAYFLPLCKDAQLPGTWILATARKRWLKKLHVSEIVRYMQYCVALPGAPHDRNKKLLWGVFSVGARGFALRVRPWRHGRHILAGLRYANNRHIIVINWGYQRGYCQREVGRRQETGMSPREPGHFRSHSDKSRLLHFAYIS